MDTYEIMYEALCDLLEGGEITMEAAEILNELAYESSEDFEVYEDKSDIQREIHNDKLRQVYSSKYGMKKRPKISKDMNDEDKINLHYYDHGAAGSSFNQRRLAARHAGAIRDDHKQDASNKKAIDLMNRAATGEKGSDIPYHLQKYFDLEKKRPDGRLNYLAHGIDAYTGTGKSKR